MKRTKMVLTALAAAVLGLVGAACSSGDNDSSSETTTTAAPAAEVVSVVVPFTAGNGSGTVTISGSGSPVAVWFDAWPGEELELPDADAEDGASVVEELVSFWFFVDGDSGDTPPSILVSASGEITDTIGTRYVVEAQG